MPKPVAAAVPTIADPFSNLLNAASQSITEVGKLQGRGNEALYQALEHVYFLKREADQNPEDFLAFMKVKFKELGLGKVSNIAKEKPFTSILKMAYGGKDVEKSTISQYAAALRHLEAKNGDAIANAGDVVKALAVKPVMERVREVRAEAASAKISKQTATLSDREALNLLRPLAVIDNAPGALGEGDHLLVVRRDSEGRLLVLSQLSEEDLDAAARTVVANRYRRLTPFPYIGNKTRQLRLLDPWLPPHIKEFREPYVGGGAVFLFHRFHNRDRQIDYWINDKNTSVYHTWKVMRDRPDEFIDKVTAIIRDTGDDEAKAKTTATQMYDDRQSSDEMTSALGFFISKLWAYQNQDLRGSVDMAKVTAKRPDMVDAIRLASQLLEGVKITNLDYGEVLSAPSAQAPEDVFLFLDPPYDDQESLYDMLMGSRTPGATKEQRKDEWENAHWDVTQQTIQAPYLWLMTHSDTPLFRERAMLSRHSTRASEIFFHEVFSPMKNRANREVLLTNYRRDNSLWRLLSDLQEPVPPNGPVDWQEVDRQVAAGLGVEVVRGE